MTVYEIAFGALVILLGLFLDRSQPPQFQQKYPPNPNEPRLMRVVGLYIEKTGVLGVIVLLAVAAVLLYTVFGQTQPAERPYGL